jgi:hypothetical protein
MGTGEELVPFQHMVFSAGDLRVSRGDAACANWQSCLANAHFLLRAGDRSSHQIKSCWANRGIPLARYLKLDVALRRGPCRALG